MTARESTSITVPSPPLHRFSSNLPILRFVVIARKDALDLMKGYILALFHLPPPLRRVDLRSSSRVIERPRIAYALCP
jgi:hypothetical protein